MILSNPIRSASLKVISIFTGLSAPCFIVMSLILSGFSDGILKAGIPFAFAAAVLTILVAVSDMHFESAILQTVNSLACKGKKHVLSLVDHIIFEFYLSLS